MVWAFLGCALVVMPQWLRARRRHAQWLRDLERDPVYREFIARRL